MGWKEREERRQRKTGTRRHLTCLPTRQSSLRARSSAGSTSGYSIATARRARSIAYERSFSFIPSHISLPCLSTHPTRPVHHQDFYVKLLHSVPRSLSIGGHKGTHTITETVSTRGSAHFKRWSSERRISVHDFPHIASEIARQVSFEQKTKCYRFMVVTRLDSAFDVVDERERGLVWSMVVVRWCFRFEWSIEEWLTAGSYWETIRKEWSVSRLLDFEWVLRRLCREDNAKEYRDTTWDCYSSEIIY